MKEISYFIKALWKYVKPIVVLVIAYYTYKYLFFFGIGYAIIATIIGKANGEPNFFEYCWKLAYSIDQTLNVLLQYPLNDTLISNKSKDKFGNPDETMSGVIGKNYITNLLIWFGKMIRKFLNLLEKNHSVNAIENDE